MQKAKIDNLVFSTFKETSFVIMEPKRLQIRMLLAFEVLGGCKESR